MTYKSKSRWPFWPLLTMQKPSKILIMKMQSGNVQTHLRSPQIGFATKSILLFKPEPPNDALDNYKDTHKVFCTLPKLNLFRPFAQTPCGHESNKTQTLLKKWSLAQIWSSPWCTLSPSSLLVNALPPSALALAMPSMAMPCRAPSPPTWWTSSYTSS